MIRRKHAPLHSASHRSVACGSSLRQPCFSHTGFWCSCVSFFCMSYVIAAIKMTLEQLSWWHRCVARMRCGKKKQVAGVALTLSARISQANGQFLLFQFACTIVNAVYLLLRFTVWANDPTLQRPIVLVPLFCVLSRMDQFVRCDAAGFCGWLLSAGQSGVVEDAGRARLTACPR